MYARLVILFLLARWPMAVRKSLIDLLYTPANADYIAATWQRDALLDIAPWWKT